MIRTLMLIIAVTLAGGLQGCEKRSVASSEPDQCVRAEQFQQCMKALPAGPVSAKYNDWDEVVSECRQTAYYQSLRDPATIKAECRWQAPPK